VIRLYDCIASGRWSHRDELERVSVGLGIWRNVTSETVDRLIASKPEVIVADNVAEYFFDRFRDVTPEGKGLRVMDSQGNLFTEVWNFAPLFPLFFVEYRMPKVNEASSWLAQHVRLFGTLFEATELPPEQRTESFVTSEVGAFFDHSNKMGKSIHTKDGAYTNRQEWIDKQQIKGKAARWVVTSYSFGQWIEDASDTAQGPVLQANYYVAEDGSLCAYPMPMAAKMEHIEEKNAVIMARTWAMMSRATMLAVTFCHAKNTVLTAHDPKANISPKLLKKQAARGKPARHKYKTIDIRPVARAIADVAKSENVSEHEAMKRLRLRGHFKSYNVTKDGRESKGLFGKHKGVYFWHGDDKRDEREGVGYRVKTS
jgi:hypothetical protein